MPRELATLLHDAIEACKAIDSLVAGRTLEIYREDRSIRSSMEREFIIIGEALRRATHLDSEFEDRIAEYSRIIAFRNILVHQYEVVDHEVVWLIACDDVPKLLQLLQTIMDEYSP